jgi:hypothetical protein
MPEDRSRSASPKRRSASPPRKRSRSPPRKPRGTGGFKWKKPAATHDDDQPRRDFQDSYRPRRYDNDRRRDDGDRRRDDRAPDRNPERSSRHGDARRDRPRGDRADERTEERRDKDGRREAKDGKQAASKPKSQARPPPAPATFIIVTVNDRLGTKASIPCLPSDTVGEFGSPVRGFALTRKATSRNWLPRRLAASPTKSCSSARASVRSRTPSPWPTTASTTVCRLISSSTRAISCISGSLHPRVDHRGVKGRSSGLRGLESS